MEDRLDHYYKWAYGQTGLVCTGKRYSYDTGEYEPDACSGTPHGLVTFTHDVLAYLEGSPPLD